MRKHLILGALLISCVAASAQEMPDPDDGYWGPRDTITFEERWAVRAPISTTKREPASETTGRAPNLSNNAGEDLERLGNTKSPPDDQ